MNCSQPSKNQQKSKAEIDTRLYSRQLYVLGEDAMRQLTTKKILICGVGGLGIEIAKNCVLGGVKSVTIQDTKETTLRDISSQFYLDEKSIGTNRATASIEKLKALNPHVKIKAHLDLITIGFLEVARFQTVVITNPAKVANLSEISEYCHKRGIAFILTEIVGVFSRVFCDFGKSFHYFDVPSGSMGPFSVVHISTACRGVVAIETDEPAALKTGHCVYFRNIEGMTGLNECTSMKITKVLSATTFEIGDTSGCGSYIRGGSVLFKEQPISFEHKSYKDSRKQPVFLETDYSKPGNSEKTHLNFLTLGQFLLNHGRYPLQGENDVLSFMRIREDIKSETGIEEDSDGSFERLFINNINVNLAPMNAFVGGFVAQEVLKSCSNKFKPLSQWMIYDAVECINIFDSVSPLSVLGKPIQNKLRAMRVFVVGAGAIGCELLKNLALMGVGLDEEGGQIWITDMDKIERSNLNRQFLFREKNIGQSKSLVAAAAIKKMNPNVNITALEYPVGPETENIFNEDFFKDIDLVANALDNIESRLFVDQLCVKYRIPLLESGTESTKANYEVIIPSKTRSLGCNNYPVRKQIPMCTVKYFPTHIHHTIQWAKELFDLLFYKGVTKINEFAKNNGFPEDSNISGDVHDITEADSDTELLSLIIEPRPRNFVDCVRKSLLLWKELFQNEVADIADKHPKDSMDSHGQPFWGGKKLPPNPIVFDQTDDNCYKFIYSTSNLLSVVCGLRTPAHKKLKAIILKQLNLVASRNDRENKENSWKEDLLHVKLSGLRSKKTCLNPKDENKGVTKLLKPLLFEKDDDNNFHIMFVTSASNCRAKNYGLGTTSELDTKRIAGNIIPAIVTTTSVVAGLASLEIYKICAEFDDLSLYRNGFLNLSEPSIELFEPPPAISKQYDQKTWNIWDRIEVMESTAKTMRQLLELFHENHRLTLSLIAYNNGLLYNSFMKQDETTTVRELAEAINKTSFEPCVRRIVLTVRFFGMTERDEMPPVHFVLDN